MVQNGSRLVGYRPPSHKTVVHITYKRYCKTIIRPQKSPQNKVKGIGYGVVGGIDDVFRYANGGKVFIGLVI